MARTKKTEETITSAVTSRDKSLKYLVIVESPNKCAHIQDYLKKAGYNVKVVASVGHISEIRNGGSYYNTGIDPTKDFAMDLAVSDEKKDVVKKISALVNTVDHVVIATDGDNEGAQICWSLIKFLKLKAGTYSRMITHEITPKAVVHAFENPVLLDTNNALASQARMCVDKIIGYSLSPISKTYVGARSVGRCQSIGLKVIVDREKEIQEFKPENYFNLYLNFKKNKAEFKAKYVGNAAGAVERLKTKAEVDAVKAACTGDYVIAGIDRKEKQEAPKPPFTTPNYQQEAASKLNLSVKDAMSLAQSLFEGGFITYHRTDCDDVSAEFIPELEQFIIAAYGAKQFKKPRVGKKTGDEQAGHECLRITNPALTPDEFNKKETNTLKQKVYKMIWQRTIAACLPNAVYAETGYLIDNNGQKFLLTSKEELDPGFKAVYSYKDDEDEDTAVVKEVFNKNETLTNTKLAEEAKATTPPARYTEATLVKQLQKLGCGRPSTFATIVDTVLSASRGYAEKDGKSIVPTERGMQLAAFLDRSFNNIIKYDYTREMEESLDKIAEGSLTKTQFLTAFYNTLEETIKANTEGKPDAPEQICPECGAKMVVRRSKYGKLFYGCSRFPDCRGLIGLK